jgi:lipopolysaccharide transport system ATP-binding protein
MDAAPRAGHPRPPHVGDRPLTPAQLMADPVLRFEHVAKRFPRYDSALGRLAAALLPGQRAERPASEILADVDFAVAPGESVAVIGPNGAGKSTILHLAAGLIEPSSGTVTVTGRVTSLLDLGGSFLPDLTGRENARFFHEVISRGDGLPAERELAVERFADIGESFDRPVRTYSDGMFLRLAFACAATDEPDVLLLDEVFAVGDAQFQQKCFRRLQWLRERGTAIVLVTHLVHNLTSLCDRALVLDRGRMIYDGPPGRGIDRYYQLFFLAPDHPATDRRPDELRYGDGGARIVDPAAAHAAEERTGPPRAGDRVTVTFDVQFERAVARPHIGFGCSTIEGLRVYTTTTALLDQDPAAARAGERRRIEIDFVVALAVGDLFVDLSVFELVDGETRVLDARIGVAHLSITRPGHYVGVADLGAQIRTGIREPEASA